MRRLLTIPISHYCEKARWALERAGLQYLEERHVQGVHILYARRAGGGDTMPVLVADEGVFGESEAILRYADERLDEARRLFPADPALRREVEDLCRWLDAGLGPDGRRRPAPPAGRLPDRLARDIRAFREHAAGAYALELFRTRRARVEA